jgi:hypothetical protein
MKVLGIGYSLAVAVLCVGCANVKGEALTSSNKDQVLTDVAKSSMNDADKAAFLAANMRATFGDYSLQGKTVDQVITEQRQYQAEQDAKAAAAHKAQLEAEAKRAALVSQLEHALDIEAVSKTLIPADAQSGTYRDIESVDFKATNTSKKAIRAFKGSMQFSDTFGDKIIKLELKDDETTLPANSSQTHAVRYEVNKFEDFWNKFATTRLSNMKEKWVPEQIIYTDGSMISAPESN